jgi:hypothetical protein
MDLRRKKPTCKSSPAAGLLLLVELGLVQLVFRFFLQVGRAPASLLLQDFHPTPEPNSDLQLVLAVALEARAVRLAAAFCCCPKPIYGSWVNQQWAINCLLVFMEVPLLFTNLLHPLHLLHTQAGQTRLLPCIRSASSNRIRKILRTTAGKQQGFDGLQQSEKISAGVEIWTKRQENNLTHQVFQNRGLNEHQDRF